jgi:flagellar biosynthesis/type III secretory pathway chaperone
MRTLKQITLLQDNLAEQNKIYSSLCHLLQSENEYLIQSDINNINKSASLKDALLKEAQKKEGERESLCTELCEMIALKKPNPRLLEIATKLPEPHRTKLIQYKSSLENLFAEIKRLNHENEILAQAALRNIGGTINVIKDALSTKETYKAAGKSTKANQQQVKHLVHKKA